MYSEKRQAVRLALTPDEHDHLRLVAAAARLSMAQYVRQLVQRDLASKPRPTLEPRQRHTPRKEPAT